MAGWYKASGWSDPNDRGITKFMKGINWALNPNHNWFDYDSWNTNSTLGKIGNFLGNAAETIGTALEDLSDPGQITSLVNSWTGAHLTGSQREANELQMQNIHDQYQQQVTGMRDAGLNPALMYQSGATAAPTVQGQQGNSNMSDLMAALLVDKQAKLLDSQIRKTDTESDKYAAETEHMKLVNQYYPSVTESQINKLIMEMGVDSATIDKIFADVDNTRLQNDILQIQKVIEQAKADNASAYHKALC